MLAGVLTGAAVFAVLPSGPRTIEPRTLEPRTLEPRTLEPGSFRSRAAAALTGGPPAARSSPLDGAVPSAVVADLVAALLWSGLPPGGALEVVHRAADELGLGLPAGLEPVREAMALAEATGLAPAGLVRSAAAEQRRREAAAAEVAARRLAVLAVLPMGLLLLPAFVLLTVAPLVLGLLGG
jgi:hypothetical protein